MGKRLILDILEFGCLWESPVNLEFYVENELYDEYYDIENLDYVELPVCGDVKMLMMKKGMELGKVVCNMENLPYEEEFVLVFNEEIGEVWVGNKEVEGPFLKCKISNVHCIETDGIEKEILKCSESKYGEFRFKELEEFKKEIIVSEEEVLIMELERSLEHYKTQLKIERREKANNEAVVNNLTGELQESIKRSEAREYSLLSLLEEKDSKIRDILAENLELNADKENILIQTGVLQEKVRSLQALINYLKKEEHEEKIKQLSTTIEKIEQERDEFQKSLVNIGKDYKILEEQWKAKLLNDGADLSEEIYRLQAEISQKIKSERKYKQEHKKSIQEKEEEFKTLKDLSEKQIFEFKEETKQAQEENKNLQARILRLLKEKEELNTKILEFQEIEEINTESPGLDIIEEHIFEMGLADILVHLHGNVYMHNNRDLKLYLNDSDIIVRIGSEFKLLDQYLCGKIEETENEESESEGPFEEDIGNWFMENKVLCENKVSKSKVKREDSQKRFEKSTLSSEKKLNRTVDKISTSKKKKEKRPFK